MNKLNKLCAYALSFVMAASFSVITTQKATSAEPAITEIPGTVKTESELNGSFLSVSGFAKGKVNDRSQYKEGDPEYAVVTNEYEFFEAIEQAKTDAIKVIELRSDMYLGWNELSEDAKEDFEGIIEPYSASLTLAVTPVGNPSLIESGISTLTINDVDGLTIFSKTGNTLKHAEMKINTDCNDVVVRNLKFDEVWEWDDWRNSGFGSTGGKGNHKRSGWTFLKLNGCNNIWIDHCTFGISFDGNVDVENGSSGITLSWCEFGDMNHEVGSMIYKTVQYLEEIYQESKKDSTVSSFVMYGIMRDSGMTPEQIMGYMSYHSKCHLIGSGDKDTWLKPATEATDGAIEDGGLYYIDKKDLKNNTVRKLLTYADTTKTNANERLRVSLGYNHYTNMGQRVPMVRSGVAHLYNCFVDDMSFVETKALMNTYHNAAGQSIPEQIGVVKGGVETLSRCMNARNEASIAADTCVWYGSEGICVGAESQTDDLLNMSKGYENYWNWNHVLAVNSKATKLADKEHPYYGSSWDNDGVNIFTTPDFHWRDNSTLGKWSWGQEGDTLSYAYQTFPIDDVEDNLKTYGGAYKIDMSANDWLKTDYAADKEIVLDHPGEGVSVEAITLDRQERTMYLGEYFQLDAKFEPVINNFKEKDLTWTSSDSNIARVNNCGLVIPVTTGAVTVSAIMPDGLTASCKVTVEMLPESVEIDGIPDTIYVGDIRTLKADVYPEGVSDRNVEWNSEGTKINFLDNMTGKIEALKAGSNRVVASSVLVGNRVGDARVTGRANLTIVEPKVYVDGIDVSVDKITISEKASMKINASVMPSDADNKEILYSSDNDAIATVDENGNVTGVSAGSVTITATSVNRGFSKTVNVTVEEAKAFEKGDVNNDGVIDSTDAVLVLKNIVMKEILSDEALSAADYDDDKKVDSFDVWKILNHSVLKDIK